MIKCHIQIKSLKYLMTKKLWSVNHEAYRSKYFVPLSNTETQRSSCWQTCHQCLHWKLWKWHSWQPCHFGEWTGYEVSHRDTPVGTRRNDNVFITSKRRRRRRFDVMKTFSLRHYCVMCPLGLRWSPSAVQVGIILIPYRKGNLTSRIVTKK